LASRRSGESPAHRWFRRLWRTAAAVAVLAFFVEGGEYGTSDLWRQRTERQGLAAEVEMLRDSVTVMQATVKAAQTDTVQLERLAREQWGMVRPGEILYWVRDPAADEDSLPGDGTERDRVRRDSAPRDSGAP